jgi:hypothetical protein
MSRSIDLKLNMEERTFAESNVATSSGSKAITYTNPFYAVPVLELIVKTSPVAIFCAETPIAGTA